MKKIFQFTTMEEIYNYLDEKPEWLTAEDISEYKKTNVLTRLLLTGKRATLQIEFAPVNKKTLLLQKLLIN